MTISIEIIKEAVDIIFTRCKELNVHADSCIREQLFLIRNHIREIEDIENYRSTKHRG